MKVRKLPTLKPRVSIAQPRISPAPPSNAADYRIRGRELQRIRHDHLTRNPWCVRCLARGLFILATELDHKVALMNGGTDTEDNRQGLCRLCHVSKTRDDLRDGG